MPTDCLNCTAPVTNNYCADYLQKSYTHRYSIKRFITHDFVHVVTGILLPLKHFLQNWAKVCASIARTKGFQILVLLRSSSSF
jgi:hypothetical protein